MKIETKVLGGFINSIAEQNDFKIILLYGEDDSAVAEKTKNIIAKFTAKNYDYITLSQDEVKGNPSLLASELFSNSMFSSNSVYSIKLLERENDFTKILEGLTSNAGAIENINNVLVVAVGGLDTKSSLRKFAEKSKYVACIACYEDNNPEIFVNKKLRQYGFVFNNDVVNYLVKNVGINTLIMANEIEKLSLYKGDEKTLTIEDLKACIKDISDDNLMDFCNNFCYLNTNDTIRVFKKILNNGIEPVVLIRTLSRYFLQMQKVKSVVMNGGDVIAAMKAEGVFWKQQNIMKIHINKWNIYAINKILEKLLELEKDIKFDPNRNTIFENFILKSSLFFHKNCKL